MARESFLSVADRSDATNLVAGPVGFQMGAEAKSVIIIFVTPHALETVMAKPGRNDPCPCGSGKKYKRCCLDKDVAAELEHERLAAAAWRPIIDVDIVNSFDEFDTDTDEAEDELTANSNAAVDLVDEGRLDEAEQVAHHLLERFPGMHDGWDRLGMVHQARGDNQKAADCYRKAIDVIRAHPENYDPGFEAIFHRLIAQLDPSAQTP
jgi:SEC-C motif